MRVATGGLAAVIGTLVILLLGGALAGASVLRGRAAASGVRILSPGSGVVLAGDRARVVVRLSESTRSFRAMVGSRVVTGAFATARGGVRVAALRYRGRGGLRFGRSTLYVQTVDARGRRWYAQVSFVVARRVGGLLGGVAARRTCAGGGTLSVGLARPGLSLKVWVNGRATNLGIGDRRRSVLLDADNGLRPGVNAIRVRALDAPQGEFSERLVRLVMGLGSPVAGAGPSRRARVGSPVRLDAGASLSAVRGAVLRYRWMIVRAPRGSRARLREATAQRPVLRPDRPGRYVLQVTVFQGPPAPPTAGLGRVGGLCATRGSSTSTVTLSAVAAPPPIGAPVDTIATQDGAVGVRVSGPPTAGGGFYKVPDPTKALQLVVLDRETLALQQNLSFGNDSQGAQALLSDVKALSNSSLVIITRPDAGVTNIASGQSASSALDQALASIGMTRLPPVLNSSLRQTCGSVGECSAFSVIGIPGLPVGQGYLNPGFAGVPSSGLAAGALSGYLQADSSNNFAFINREQVPFDTGDPNPNVNPAVITVGSNDPGSEAPKQTYTSDTLATGQAGFFVEILDAGSLIPLDHGTFVDDNAGLTDMSTLLYHWVNKPAALVLVRSIGSVGRVSSGGGQNTPWDTVAGLIGRLGGSTYYFNALDGKSSAYYAQVGPAASSITAYPKTWGQVASTERSGSGRLTGLLARNIYTQFYPDESVPLDSSGNPLALTGTLPGLISTPPVPWPDRDTSGDQLVLNCIAAHITSYRLPTPIESNYINQNLIDSWDGFKQTLDASDYFTTLTGYRGCNTIFRPDFDAVKAQLDKEWPDIAPVINLVDNLKKPFTDTAPGAGADVLNTAAAVNQDVGTSSQQVTADPLVISEDAFWIASSVPIPGLSNVLNLISGSLALISDFETNSDGTRPLLDVTSTAADLGAKLQTTYLNAIQGLNQLGNIILSNWGMLQVAAANAAGSPDGTANWKVTDPDASDNSLRLNARRLAYQTLFPARYRLYRLSAGTGTLNPMDVTGYRCVAFRLADTYYTDDHYPFAAVPRFGGDAPVVSGEGTVEQWVYAGPDDGFITNPEYAPAGQFPTESLLVKMFSDHQTDLDYDHPLFNLLQFPVEAYTSATYNTESVTHVNASKPNASTNEFCQTSGP